MIVDAGYGGPEFDAGERLVSRELYRLGVKKLDVVLLTHPDADHIGGLKSIAARFEIGKIIIPLRFVDHPAIQELEQAVQIPLGRYSFVNSHAELSLGSIQIQLDCPPPEQGADDNAGSMITRVVRGTSSALLVGDATKEEESWFLSEGKAKYAQILKLGHHGSRTSSSPEFLDSIRPSIAVISCGRGNRYGHPHREILDLLTEKRIVQKRTDLQGTITYRPGQSGFEETPN
jgi:competence protein ComEC